MAFAPADRDNIDVSPARGDITSSKGRESRNDLPLTINLCCILFGWIDKDALDDAAGRHLNINPKIIPRETYPSLVVNDGGEEEEGVT